MTELETQKLVNALFAAFPGTTGKMTPDQVRASSAVYRMMLSDFDYETAHAAIKLLLVSSKFLPTIAEVRAAVVENRAGGAKSGAEAWGEVQRAIGRYGYMRVPGVDFEFADARVGRVVAAFGWRQLCDSENATADRARFIEAYEKMQEGDKREALIGGLLPANARPQLPRGTVALGEAIGSLLGSGAEKQEAS